MDIKGLDMTQISRKLAVFVESYFEGFTLPSGDSLFAESYLLHFEEVKDGIPEQYHCRFTDADRFNGAAGFIEVDGTEHCIMLLSDERYDTAYILSKQESDGNGNERTVIIKDFFA